MGTVPAISMFYGIIIYMYSDDHMPPHFHAQYQDCEGLFDLDGSMINGKMPAKQRRLITAWAQLHSDELLANWTLAKRKEHAFRIEPLR